MDEFDFILIELFDFFKADYVIRLHLTNFEPSKGHTKIYLAKFESIDLSIHLQ